MSEIENKNTQLNADKLRFGILCNGYHFKKWQVRIIDQLIESGNTELCLLVINKTITDKNSLLKKLCSIFRKDFIFRLHKKFIFNPDYIKEINLSQKLNTIPYLQCEVIKKGKYSEYFYENDIKIIKDKNLDFILRFGFNIIRGDILRSAKFGIWSYHHDDAEKYRGGPAGLWEIYYNDHVNGATLQILTDKLDSGVILRKGYFKTINHSYSANIDNLYYGSSSWPVQVCNDIKNGLTNYFFHSPLSSRAKIYTVPSNLKMLKFIAKLFLNKLKFHYNELFRSEQWNIGIVKKSLSYIIEYGIPEKEIIWAPAQSHKRFKADSFAYTFEHKIMILFECFDYKTRTGTIREIIYNEKDGFSGERTVLEKPYHLSYPYIFSCNDEWYCIPESFGNRQVDIYKIDKTSGGLNFHKTILENTDNVDSSVYKYNDKWWLFCTKNSEDSNSKLFLYYSDNFDGPYQPHQANPVKTDIRSARPAGNLFIKDKILYRPAQDCSKTYGGKIALNKIKKLNTLEFEEETEGYISQLKNCKFNIGIHTICEAGNYTIFDAKRHKFVSAAFCYKLIKKIKKLLSIRRNGK